MTTPVLPDGVGIQRVTANQFSKALDDDLLFKVERPGQYLGNEWGALRKPFDEAQVRLVLAFPDIYELGMSNFGLRILYQIVNSKDGFLADRTYAPAEDMEALLRERRMSLWGWESRQPLADFELLGFSLQYELTYTNVLNMLDLSGIPVEASNRTGLFPLVFGGGPSAVNPEPMAKFMDFFIIGDGEEAVVAVMEVIKQFKASGGTSRHELLLEMARQVPGVYVPSLYTDELPPKPKHSGIPNRVLRQTQPLNDGNQPTGSLVSYLSLVHDREVLEVRRGCDRGCRFCQPGYTFLPVRERSADDLVRLSKESLAKSGHEEYSMLSLCVSDYTSLHESVRSLNREHAARRTSMSFPSQRADRMNLEIAEELKAVRKSGITLAPEAGTERLRAVINKGLRHEQIISAIESAYISGWTSIKLYYMIGLPTEQDEDLAGIVDTLKEATGICRRIRNNDPQSYRRDIEFTCTISNFVPKPFTPFQWFGQTTPEEFERKQQKLRELMRGSKLKNVTLNCTSSKISLLEAVISRGSRSTGDLIYSAWKKGCKFDAWDEKLKDELWHQAAHELGLDLKNEACTDRKPGSDSAWDVIHVGLAGWWLVKEWEKALSVSETAPCTENTCHACGVCTELETVHILASPSSETMKKNPFVQKLFAPEPEPPHPSLAFEAPPQAPPSRAVSRLRVEFSKHGQLKFISHLDLQHLFIRAARRAGVLLAYTEGFNPSPKIQIALSLPLYAEAAAEIADFELAESIDPDEFRRRLNQQLPAEVQIVRAKIVSMTSVSPSTLIGRARWRATADGLDADAIQSKIDELLNSQTLIIESQGKKKKGSKPDNGEVKTSDLRPGIFSLTLSNRNPVVCELFLAQGVPMHVRPQDVLKLIAPNTLWKICRTELLAADGQSVFELSAP